MQQRPINRIGKTLKSAVLDMLYQVTIKKWIFQIAGSATGGLGMSAANAGTGGSGNGYPLEMTAGDSGISYLMLSAGSQQRMALAFAGLVVIGAMAMIMHELFSYIEKHTTAWAHRGTQGD